MISVTHFMDRDGQMLADVTPRRYFCNACHVSQTDAKPLVANTFRDAAQTRVACALGRAGLAMSGRWRVRRPSVLSLGFLTLGGFACGVVFWGGFNTALEFTNTETFCLSCHEMRSNVYQELSHTVHFSNRSGVRAICSDCHVPHNWTDKIARKMQASKEVWGHLFGTIDTRQKFLDHRLVLAEHEWARLKANDSLQCRNCHSAAAMDLTKQNARAARIHQRYLLTGERTLLPADRRQQPRVFEAAAFVQADRRMVRLKSPITATINRNPRASQRSINRGSNARPMP